MAFGVVSIITGITIGYLIGGRESLRPVDRVLLGCISGLICGIMVSIVMMPYLPSHDTVMILSLIAGLTGTLFGESLNWAPTPKKQRKQHIYFDLDDEEEFDREIEEALRGT